MNRIDNSGQGIASLGRDEDQYMAHVAQGEMLVPPVISQETRQRIEQEMKAAGLSPNEYTVGNGMSINPITGQPEFGWLKKTFKSIKKVAKKVAPIALAVGGGGMLSGLFGGSGVLGSLFKPGAGILGGSLGPGIKSTLGNVFKSGSGIFGGNIGPSIKSGIASLFGGAGGQEETMYQDGDGNFYTASQVNEMVNSGNIPDSGFMEVSGSNFNIGRNILGKGNTPDFIKSFEDRLKGEDGKFGGGDGMFGGNGGLAALAALYGKATYDASKERQGGLSLTPEVSMDSLGRYSLAKSLGTGGTREEFGLGPAPKSLSLNMGGEARQYFNQGGLAAIAELDMRDGGESDGPGTGTSDDIPAMLSDGEFVMTAKATKGAGAFNVNKTKSGIELISGGKASRKKGVENMRELMDIFEAI